MTLGFGNNCPHLFSCVKGGVATLLKYSLSIINILQSMLLKMLFLPLLFTLKRGARKLHSDCAPRSKPDIRAAREFPVLGCKQ